MLRRFSVNYVLLSMSLDAFLVVAVATFMARIRPLLNDMPFATEVVTPMLLPMPLYLLFPAIWVSILMLATVYDGQRNLRAMDELTSLTFGSLLASVCLAGICYFSFRDVSRLMFALFSIVAYLFMVTWRLVSRVLFHLGWFNGVGHRRMLIVGAGELGRDLRERICRDNGWGLEFVGFLDDETPPQADQNEPILGRINDIRRIISTHQIDDVVLALPVSEQGMVNTLVAELHDLPVKVWVIPSYFALALFKADVVDYAGVLMLDLRAPALNEYQRLVKRMFDIVVSMISLPVAIPLMALEALLIRLDTPGPIIFCQKRVGENGKIFLMYKFRTMIDGAEKMNHIVEHKDIDGNLIYKTQNDPRVTHVGRFLRHTSLDELPQIINVLKGDMSLVGPRPELPYLVERYAIWQRKRFAVPQGITGWWQINGRSDKPMHLHTEDDLFYVQNYSIWLDLEILLKTFWVALSRKGAF